MEKKYIVKTLFNLEEVLAAELIDLEFKNVEILNRAVSFIGSKKDLYKANYLLRTAIKILMPIAKGNVSNEKELYDFVYSINWSKYLGLQNTFAIDAAVNSNHFNHSKYVGLKSKDAIVDQFRNKTGRRPNVELVMPEIRINIHIYKNECTISLDSSGESLHKRGYRTGQGIAPLNEVLAAGLIRLSEWNQENDLFDPFCGSGTILIEGVMSALNIPAQYNRKEFSFMHWKGYDEELWRLVKKESRAGIRKRLDTRIYGSDISIPVINKAKENVVAAGIHPEVIQIHRKDFRKFDPYENEGTIITNPPYGERIDIQEESFFKDLGDAFKNNFQGFEAWVLSPNNALKHLGLKTSKRYALKNAKLDVKFHKYELYKGSKKQKSHS